MKHNTTNTTTQTMLLYEITERIKAKRQREGKDTEQIIDCVIEQVSRDKQFHSLIERYNAEQTDVNIINLCTATTYAVLNKIEQASGSRYVHMVRVDIASGRDTTLIAEAVRELLEQTERQRESKETIDLERVYIKRVPIKNTVIIDSAELDDNNYYQDIETTPIHEIYRAVRRAFDSMGHKRAQSATYTYNEKIITDNESGQTDTIYIRNKKYYDTGAESNCYFTVRGGRKDRAGALPLYSADTDSAEADRIAEGLNLTARQALVLHYRRQGFGYKAIGRKLNVSFQAIQKTVGQIQKKAEAQGLTADRAQRTGAERSTEAHRRRAERLTDRAEAERRAEAQLLSNTEKRRAEAEQRRREAERRAEAERRRESNLTQAQRDARRRLIERAESKRRAEAERLSALTDIEHIKDIERQHREAQAHREARRRLIDKAERRG